MSIATADRVRQRDKIIPFDELPRLRARFTGQKIVLCHGAFDLVHIGHLIHFEEARAAGDVLVVTITADAHITKKRSVTFSEDHRARQVAALEIVDYVAVVQEPTALSAIEALHPDVYVKGPEYADLMLDKSRSIYHEMRVLETLRRPHPVHVGRDVFVDQAVALPAGVAGGLAGQPAAAQRARDVPRRRQPRIQARSVEGVSRDGPRHCASASSARRSSTSGWTSR